MKELKNFDTGVIVASTLYYEKKNFVEFCTLFDSLNVVDVFLSEYVKATNRALKAGSFDKLPAEPDKRKNKLVKIYRAQLSIIPDKYTREKCLDKFNDAIDYDSDLELSEELVYRYCWSEFVDRVRTEDDSDTSFQDKLTIKPTVPTLDDKKIVPLSEVVVDKKTDETVFPTGIKSLDKLAKMRLTNFVVVAARTTVGKSLFMISQAINLALSGEKILYVSLEESQEEIKKRVDAYCFGMSREKIETVFSNFVVCNPDTGNPDVIFDMIENNAEDLGIRVVFIDYIQLMRHNGMNEFDSLRRLTREFKLFAIKNKILLVTASQVRRDAEIVGSSLTTLYGSSTLEADANIIILIEPVRKQNVRINNKTAVNLVVAKNRNGEQGTIENATIDYSTGKIMEGE